MGGLSRVISVALVSVWVSFRLSALKADKHAHGSQITPFPED